MAHRRYLLCVPLLVLSLLALSCSSTVYRDLYPTLLDGKYDSEFPYRASSKQLEEIAETVKMLTTIAYYRTLNFTPEEHIRSSDLTPEFLRDRDKDAVFVNKSLSGTATVIWAEGRRIVLLTCAHIVAFPDTTISYHIGPDRHPTPFVKTLSIKERQMNFVGMLPEGGELEVLAYDVGADIALLGKQFEQELPIPIRVFSYPVGRASELEWGSFVYLFGYPSGYRIVTKGIVSNPNRDKRGSFLVDAVFGGGFSGGIALAIRDGVPNFELVGMVKMVSARSSYILTPRRDDSGLEYDPTVPYNGEIYVDRHTDIEYGVTQAVSIEAILEFLNEKRSALIARGYPVQFKVKPAQR
jgi:hypothetical protein